MGRARSRRPSRRLLWPGAAASGRTYRHRPHRRPLQPLRLPGDSVTRRLRARLHRRPQGDARGFPLSHHRLHRRCLLPAGCRFHLLRDRHAEHDRGAPVAGRGGEHEGSAGGRGVHLWLPDAYEHAPSSVNSLIAPVMTKVAAYAMLRMFLSVFPPGYLSGTVPIADALLVLGLIGIVFGSVAAAGQTDIRRMLAYSSISQLAFIAVGIGLGTPLALAAALLHVVNHAAMKATLFLATASVRFRVGLQRTHNLAGLGPRMPLTMGAFAVGSVAMVGIPPTAGFFSKWYMVQAGVDEGQWIVVAVVLLSSLLTAVYLFKVLEQVYLRPAKPEPSTHHDDEHDSPGESASHPVEQQAMRPVVERAREAPLDVWLPLVLLGAATVVLGVFNVVIMEHVLLPGVS
ncbi:MAG: hypothetical protein F4Y96_04820 [Chloroflexi bacterium]|nr:hypothetical protein [Chloroflexota bacterium]